MMAGNVALCDELRCLNTAMIRFSPRRELQRSL